MSNQAAILVTDYMPMLGRVLVSVVSRYRQDNDKLESCVAYYAQDDFCDNVFIYAERWDEKPVVDEACLHQTAISWVEDKIFERCFDSRSDENRTLRNVSGPLLRAIDDSELAKLWLSKTATNAINYLASSKGLGINSARLRSIKRMPQIEVVSPNSGDF